MKYSDYSLFLTLLFMTIFLNLLLSAIAIAVASYLIPGATVDNYLTAFIVAVVLAIVNTTIVPILQVLTLPLNILTLGLVSLIINILMVLLVARIVPGFEISGFWVALVFAVVLALVNMVF